MKEYIINAFLMTLIFAMANRAAVRDQMRASAAAARARVVNTARARRSR